MLIHLVCRCFFFLFFVFAFCLFIILISHVHHSVFITPLLFLLKNVLLNTSLSTDDSRKVNDNTWTF